MRTIIKTGLMTDRQRAIHFMNKAFALYEHSERIQQARGKSCDWIERHTMLKDANALHLEANNAAKESMRFFNRC